MPKLENKNVVKKYKNRNNIFNNYLTFVNNVKKNVEVEVRFS